MQAFWNYMKLFDSKVYYGIMFVAFLVAFIENIINYRSLSSVIILGYVVLVFGYGTFRKIK